MTLILLKSADGRSCTYNTGPILFQGTYRLLHCDHQSADLQSLCHNKTDNYIITLDKVDKEDILRAIKKELIVKLNSVGGI